MAGEAYDFSLIRDILTIGIPIFASGGLAFMVNSQNKDITDIKDDLKLLNKVVLDQALSNQRQDNFEDSTNQRIKRMEDDIKEIHTTLTKRPIRT